MVTQILIYLYNWCIGIWMVMQDNSSREQRNQHCVCKCYCLLEIVKLMSKKKDKRFELEKPIL